MIPSNACTLRITAAAGTELADAYSYGTCNKLHVVLFTPIQKKFTTRRAVILHATWLVQTLVHWPIFLTAASRRSLDRVSVPVWGINLSVPLSIVALVSRYLTNWLMERMPIFYRLIFSKYYHAVSLRYGVLIRISPGYSPVEGRLHTCYSPVRRSSSKYCYFMLPLDLHVLGLSLAFILSQDQTLLCISFFIFFEAFVFFYSRFLTLS